MRFILRIAAACAFWYAATVFGQQSATTPASAIPSTLTLSDALQLLSQRSPAILAEAQSIPVAKAQVEAAAKLANPILLANSESYPAFSSQPGSVLNNQELTGTVSQTIQTAGKRRKRTDVARQALLVAGSNLQNFQRRLAVELRQRYWAAALASAQAKLARLMLTQFDDTLRLNETRYQQGEVSGLERTRLQTERLRFWNDVQQSDLDLSNAKSALLELLAAPQDTQFDIADPLVTSVPLLPVQELTEEALANRPDLVAQQQTVEEQRREISYQKSLAIPDVTVAAGYKRNFGVDSPVLNIQVPLPIFNRNQGGIHAAEAQRERERRLLDKQRLQVEREVKQAADTLKTQQIRAQEISKIYVPESQKALDIAVQSYRLGSLDLLQLLDAERVYRDTQRTANQAYFDLRIAESSLEAAIGKESIQ
jgi:cobalt-zinc-cadmium efflux system outer membrane protein